MRIRFPIAIVLALLVPTGHAHGDAKADFERAMRAIDAGDYEAAVASFTTIIKSRELGAAGLAVVHQNRGHSFLALKL